MKLSKSIMQSDKRCYVTGRTDGLHRHHIFYGPNRKNSEKYGCWVYLIGELHNLSNRGVHFNREFDLALKQECQRRFEALHGHELFMKIFGKNYLEDDDEREGND